MTEDYCKLASGIILSTIWREDDHTRLLWITLLALKGRDHRVLASVPGLAAVANIPLAACRAGLVKLATPDPDSRTKEHEGRRIMEVDGGWLILNGEKYRNFMSKQERNEYQARLMSERRSAAKLAPVSTKLAPLAHTEAEAEAKKRGEPKDASLPLLALVKEVFDGWNAAADNVKLPKCLVLSDKRRRSVEQRLRDPFFVANWKAALERLLNSQFCCGENPRGWRASFEWFVTPDAVQKIMEGKYDNRSKTSAVNNPRLVGVSRNNAVNNYADLAKRKLERQMAEAENRIPPEAQRIRESGGNLLL